MTHVHSRNDLILLNQADNKNGYKHLQIIDGKLVLISEVSMKTFTRRVNVF